MNTPGPADVSVVIATRDRPESLLRLLRSIAAQSAPPREVVVASAGIPPSREALQRVMAPVPVTVVHGEPSVCRQRNEGIRRAAGPLVLLCDDDIELPPGYLEMLLSARGLLPDEAAVCGLLHEGGAVPGDRLTPAGLVWRRLFHMGVWADVAAVPERGVLAGLVRAAKAHYRRAGNTLSAAGWPLFTRWDGAVVRTLVYGLGGGALVPRAWLLASPYDELLDANGIGDNYGVALGFPGELHVAVVKRAAVVHHRDPAFRPDAGAAWTRRVYALDYFGSRSPRLGAARRAALLWSLAGRLLAAAASLRMAEAGNAAAVIIRLAAGRNPYIRARRDAERSR